MKGSFIRYLCSILCASFLYLTLSLFVPAIVYAAPTSQIFVLHSYSQEYPWTRAQHEGFIKTLEDDAQTDILVSTEYLDTKRRAYDEPYASEISRHLRLKYADYKPAAIYVTDDNALLFARDHLSRIFPGVPVFFSGVNDYGVQSSLDPALFTGVFERKEFTPNIEWLLRVDKLANDLIFVGDGSNTYDAIESELRRDLIPYHLRSTFIAEKSLDRLLARLHDLPGKYLFLTTLGGMTDENGHVLTLSDILKSLVNTGRIVISMEDVYITEGVLGGYVTSGQQQGLNAARFLLAYQHGTPIVDMPPILKSPNAWIFDDRSLLQHGVKFPDDTRTQAILLHQRPGLYERFRSIILGALIVLAVSLLLVVTMSIVYLSRKNRVLRLAQNNTGSANALFHQLAEQTRTMHWEVNAEGLYTDVSDISEAITGYRPEEIIGRKHFYDLHPEEGREAFKTEVFKTFVKREPFLDLENPIQSKDQQLIWVTTYGIPLLDSNGNFAGYRGSDTDITERKRAEAMLSASENRARSIIESSPMGMHIYRLESDDRLVFTGYNPAADRILGVDHRSYIGKTIEEAFPSLKDSEVPQRYRQAAFSGHAWQTENIVYQDNTIKGAFEVHAFQSEPNTVVAIFTEITERKQAEEEKRSLQERLNRAEKMEALGVLAGGVAHDLNNFLGVIVGYSELLLLEGDKSSAIRPQLEAIMKGSHRAAAIVQDLLALARRGVSGRDVVNLNRIISDMSKLLESQSLYSYHPSVQIHYDLEPDLPNISGSSVHLGKALFNLMSNGCEAMPNGGILTIRTVSQYLEKPIDGYDEIHKGDYVVLSVSDTGGGISKADLKSIFEPFYTKKVMGRSGTGLGLAVVWGTVKDHDGYINVQSELGKGSTFTLYFPVTREGLTVEHEPVPPSKYTGKGETILIVDDIEEQRDLATEMLRKLNYHISSIASGEEAVMYLKSHSCDLLILDMIMDPGMDGLDTYKKVLEIFPKQKAIIVSGFSESNRVRNALELGAGAYVRKPYTIEKLGLAVRKELDRDN